MERLKYNEYVKYLENNFEEFSNKRIKELEKETKNYEVKLGILYKRDKNENLLRILRENEVESILWMAHDHPTGGHFAKDSVYEKIKRKYYWKGMYKDIESYIRKCNKCQRRGQQGGKGFLNPIEIGKPFEQIGIDFIGPLEKTKKGNRYICVVTDYLTKWPEAKAMRNATAENVVKFIYEEIICRHGCPKNIISDRGTHFRNQLVDGLCEKFRIKHKLSSPYHPQTNGLVERFNRTLCEILAKTAEENNWDEYLESALFAYRTTKHSTTKETPFYMIYGREASLPFDPEENDQEHYSNFNEKKYSDSQREEYYSGYSDPYKEEYLDPNVEILRSSKGRYLDKQEKEKSLDRREYSGPHEYSGPQVKKGYPVYSGVYSGFQVRRYSDLHLKESTLARMYELLELANRRVEVTERIKKTQENRKSRYDSKIKNETTFSIGDKVLLKDAAKEKQWSGKLAQKWKGPYYIHNIIGKGAYKLKTLEGKILKSSFNVQHLKFYYD